MKKFLSYKTHFILLVILASAVSSTAMLVKSKSSFDQNRQAMMRSETIQKMNPFKRIVGFKIDEMKTELLNFALNRKTQKTSFGAFNSIAQMQSGVTDFVPKWIESDAQENWTPEYQAAGLKSIPFQKIEGSGFSWFKYQEGGAKPIYFSVFEIEAHHKDLNKKAYIVGMSSQNPLVSITDDYRGTSGKVYLLNDRASVAAHTNKVYDGASFSADPVFKDLKSSKRAMSSGAFVDLSGDSIFADYEKIEHSNLYAVVSSPRLVLKATQEWQAGLPFIFGMLGFFGFVAFMFAQNIKVPAAGIASNRIKQNELDSELGGNNNKNNNIDIDLDDDILPLKLVQANQDESAESEFESLERKLAEVKNLRSELTKKGLSSLNPFTPAPVIAAPIVNNAPVTKAENSEKSFELIKMMSSGLSRIFSERVSGIIAESSLILAKTSDEDVVPHAKLIQSEARKSRDLLRELEQFSADKILELSPVNLAEVCEHALTYFRNEIETEGIEVKKDLDVNVQVRASIEKLQISIQKIIANSIEAMKGREEKVLSLKLEIIKNRIELSVSDTGVGMPKDTQEKIFMPFYRGFSHTDGNGLGLSYVQGVLNAMKAEIQVQSSPGAGTEIKLSIPNEEIASASNAKTQIKESRKKYDGLINPKLDLDFLGDVSEEEPKETKTDKSYFELEEADLDQEFDLHLKKLSDKIIQKKQKVEAAPPEFNVLTDFEDEDEDADNFKVVIREPRTKPLS